MGGSAVAVDYPAMTSRGLGPLRPASGQRARVLCIDDEPLVLEGLRDVLRRSFSVTVAESGAEGLEILKRDAQAFAVVISDMQMPGMPGSAFLRDAKRLAPLAVRMLLTGYADTDAAVRAVNDGQIFRFLTKPCDRNELLGACTAALLQHRVLAAERVILEQTLRGSVQALTDVLTVSNPAAFGRGVRIKRTMARFAQEAGVADAWELEVAAMLAHAGAVTLPAETAERLYACEPLDEAEQAMVDRVPAASARIVATIPRLEGVQQIVEHHRRRADSVDTDGALPVGAAMLRIAVDFDDLRGPGHPPRRRARHAARA